ncbi:MAG: inorganic phosphate transporter [Rhodocyclales bacterium]|nr:inorganic phosphate transporter [Rhodocyclales bacterium]
MEAILVGVALFLAFGNGANDNFKGFATVWGADVLDYRRALVLATLATLAGSLASLLLAPSLVAQFTGRGLVPDAVAAAPTFMLHAGAGAALTVFAATRAGLPVSTTHALIGGLVGAGLAEPGREIHLGALAGLFLLPLLASPLLAAALGMLAARALRRRPGADCACVIAPTPALVAQGDGSRAVASIAVSPAPTFVIADNAHCRRQPGLIARLALPDLADRAHVLSAAAICFARGVNDTPKLAALLLAGQILDATAAVAVIAAAMAAGGILFAHRVAETMSKRVTRLDNGQGLAANLITTALVLCASKLGLPVSTTHVAVGSIAGIGAAAGTLDRTTVRHIALAWVVTLPMAAGLAWLLA